MSNKKQTKVFLIIKDFVLDKKDIEIERDTNLYSSGILDSLDMFELILILERNKFNLNFENKDISNKLLKLDSAQHIIEKIIYD